MISTGSDKDNDTITDQDSNVLTDNGGNEVTNGNIKHALMDLGAFLSVRKFGERVFNGQAHHMLSRFLNLRIYEFLHESFFYLVHLIRTTNANLKFLQRIFVYLLC